MESLVCYKQLVHYISSNRHGLLAKFSQAESIVVLVSGHYKLEVRCASHIRAHRQLASNPETAFEEIKRERYFVAPHFPNRTSGQLLARPAM